MDEHACGESLGPDERPPPLDMEREGRGSITGEGWAESREVRRARDYLTEQIPKRSLKGHTVSIVGFMDHLVSVPTTHLSFTKTATDSV